MYLQIDPNDGNPIYMQIIEQIKRAISIGVFEVGKPVPTIREIAIELRINPNTVAKAIRELEREGVLKTYVGKGSFVTENSINIAMQENMENGEKLAEQFVKDLQWLGFDKKETVKLVENNWEKVVQENIKNV